MADENMQDSQMPNSNEESTEPTSGIDQSQVQQDNLSGGIDMNATQQSQQTPPQSFSQNTQSYNQGYNQNYNQSYNQNMGMNQQYTSTPSYNSYGGISNQGYGYDPYGGMQQGYGQMGYDPYGGMQQGYGQMGYDPYGGMQQGYDFMGYDPNMYGSMYAQDTSNQSTPSNPTRVSVTPNNPMRVQITPNNPATSSNNITLNLENMEKMLNEQNKSKEIIDKNEKLKLMLVVFMENNIDIELYSNQNDEMPIASGRVNMVTNQTISIENKIVAIKYISYIKFSNKYITENKIHEFFGIINTPRQKSFEYKIISDFYNLLYSKILFNQISNIMIDASFMSEIKDVNVVNLNTEICILKSDEFYFLIELDKIVSIE